MTNLATTFAVIVAGVGALVPRVANAGVTATMTFEPGAGSTGGPVHEAWTEGPGFMLRLAAGDVPQDVSEGSFRMGDTPGERGLLAPVSVPRIYLHSFYLDASAPIELSDLTMSSPRLVITPDGLPGFEFIDLASYGLPDGYFGRHGGVGFHNTDTSSFRLDNVNYTVVPEPGAWVLALVGFGMLGGAMRFQRNRAVGPSSA
jgi:hypothetical protein